VTPYPRIREGDTISGAPFPPGSTGAPILTNAPAYVECTLEATIEKGDYSIFVGKVVDVGLPKPPEGRADDATLWLRDLGEKGSRPSPRHAHLAGFDLHANVAVPGRNRTHREQLCRYLLRPAVAQDRLGLLADGRAVLTLKAAWADGTRQLVFEPMELLEKLAALTPRPGINLVLHHGVLAPHARWRARGGRLRRTAG
jgi:hypothetical protein